MITIFGSYTLVTRLGINFSFFFFELLLYFINARLYLLYKHLYVFKRFTIKVKNDEIILQKKFYYSRNQGN